MWEDLNIAKWVQKKQKKYTSRQIHNEILKSMALDMLRSISKDIENAIFYSVMAGEIADVPNSEQLVLCIR